MFEGCSPASPPSARAQRGLRADQPHAGAGRVEVHLPVATRRQRVPMSARGEELRRAVRALGRRAISRRRDELAGRGAAASAQPAQPARDAGPVRAGGSTSPAPRSARPPWPPNPPRVKVDALPRYAGDVDAAGDEHVGAQPAPSSLPTSRTAPGGHADRLPGSDRLAVDGRRAFAAGHAAPSRRRRSAARARPACTRGPARPRRCRAPGCRGGRTGRPSAPTAARRPATARPARASPAPWSSCPARGPRWPPRSSTSMRKSALSPVRRSRARDDHPDRRRVEAVAGVVDLRAVGDQHQRVDVGAQGRR